MAKNANNYHFHQRTITENGPNSSLFKSYPMPTPGSPLPLCHHLHVHHGLILFTLRYHTSPPSTTSPLPDPTDKSPAHGEACYEVENCPPSPTMPNPLIGTILPLLFSFLLSLLGMKIPLGLFRYRRPRMEDGDHWV